MSFLNSTPPKSTHHQSQSNGHAEEGVRARQPARRGPWCRRAPAALLPSTFRALALLPPVYCVGEASRIPSLGFLRAAFDGASLLPSLPRPHGRCSVRADVRRMLHTRAEVLPSLFRSLAFHTRPLCRRIHGSRVLVRSANRSTIRLDSS